jgi:hypothetical protein
LCVKNKTKDELVALPVWIWMIKFNDFINILFIVIPTFVLQIGFVNIIPCFVFCIQRVSEIISTLILTGNRTR